MSNDQIETKNKMLMLYNECLKLATIQKNKRDKCKNLLHYFVVVTFDLLSYISLLSSLWKEHVFFISSQQQDVCAQENDDLPLYLSCHVYLCIQMSTVCPGDTYNVTCTLFSEYLAGQPSWIRQSDSGLSREGLATLNNFEGCAILTWRFEGTSKKDKK